MSLNKSQLKAALSVLSITFIDDATNAVLEVQLIDALKEKLDSLDIEFPTGASAETLYELYTVATQSGGEIGRSGQVDDEDEEYFEFSAVVAFRQPWLDGIFAKKKNEKFDCDDEKLIGHLQSNALIVRN
jgi:hypothetical protein